MTHVDRAHHRPAVRRLPAGLGAMRWVSSCPQCSHFIPATFWRAALIAALIHSQELR